MEDILVFVFGVAIGICWGWISTEHAGTDLKITRRRPMAIVATLLLASAPTVAHVLQFTPTESVGSYPWPNPTEVTIIFGGSSASGFEVVVPGGGIGGYDDGVTSYADGLVQTSVVRGLLPLHENAQGSTVLEIDTVSLTVDDIQGSDELAVRGGVEGYGSDGFTPCGTAFQGPFAGGCEAAGVWKLDGVPVNPDPVPEPASGWLLVMALAATAVVRGRRWLR